MIVMFGPVVLQLFTMLPPYFTTYFGTHNPELMTFFSPNWGCSDLSAAGNLLFIFLQNWKYLNYYFKLVSFELIDKKKSHLIVVSSHGQPVHKSKEIVIMFFGGWY